MEIILENTFDKLNYNRFVSSPYINTNSIFVFFGNPFVRYTIADEIDKLKIRMSRVRYFYVPQIQRKIGPVTVNTKKTLPEIMKLIEEKPIKLIKTLPRELTSSMVVDLFPIHNQMSRLFESNKLKAFDIYFDVIDKMTKSLKDKYEYNIFNILYLDPNDDNKEFLNELLNYLKRKMFMLHIKNVDDLYVCVKGLKTPVYGKIGEYNERDEALVINRNMINKVLKIYESNKKESVNETLKSISKDDVNNIVEKMLNKYGIRKKDVRNNIKTIVAEYIEKNKHEISSDVDFEDILTNAFKEVAGVEKSLKSMNNDEKKRVIEEIGKTFVIHEEVKPVVDDRYEKIFKVSDILNTQTTVVNRHKREFDEILDTYIEKIFSSLEEGEEPLKIVKIKKEKKDNNVNRFIQYKFLLKDKRGNDHEIKINIPDIVNDRYFKLNGKLYILTNQLFLRPITKSKHESVRFLSNYATITLELKNVKIPVSNINEILTYTVSKYNKHIISVVENKDNEQIDPYIPPLKYKEIVFDNNIIFYGYNPLGNGEFIIFEEYDNDGNVIREYIYNQDERKVFLVENDTKIEIKEKPIEFIVEKIISILKKYNPTETLAKTQKSIPYIQIHVAGVKLPYIKWLICMYGIIPTLEKLSIKYSIDEKVDDNAYYSIIFKDKVINIYCEKKRCKYIINGLKLSKIDFSKYSFDEFESNENTRKDILANHHGQTAVINFNLIKDNIVDTITKDLLEYEGKSTNIFDILTNDMIDTLFNETPKSPVDLRYARARLSEIMLNVLYKQMAMAKNDYTLRAKLDKTAKIYIDPDYVINQMLQGESTLQYVEPLNPIDELNTATRITPKGIGGVPKASITLEHRMIPWYTDENGKPVTSFFGNISALDTNEYANVGVNQQLTMNSLVSDKFGLFGIKHKLPKSMESLGIGEALAPWMSSIDHDRSIKMAQQMRQTIPFIKTAPPIVQSGCESLIPQMSSSRFVVKAKKDGKVKEVVDGEYILVEYDDGTKELLDIHPRLARTKRGLFVSLDINPEVKPGDKVKAGQILGGTSQFKNGLYVFGRNVRAALMPYGGGSFEDGWVVSEDVLDDFKYKELKEVIVIIPDDSSVDEFETEIGKEIKRGDILLSFGYNKDIDSYINNYDIEMSDDINTEDVYNIEDKLMKVKSPVNGVLKDIKIYINGRVDAKIESVHRKILKRIKDYIKKSEKINGKDNISYLDNIDTTMFKRGTFKHKGRLFKGAKVVFLIEVEKRPLVGSKFVARGGAKGTITYVIPKDKKPVTKETNMEIDWIFNTLSVIGRKNANILLELGVGKVLYFLNKRAKEMAETSKIKTKEIKALVLDVYNALDQTEKKETYNIIKTNLNNISDDEFRKMCKSIDPLDNPLFVWYAIPFSEMKIEWIKEAADILNIPLEEKVYLPEFDFTTENKVTTGIIYMAMLEHMPDSMVGVRSTGKYQVITGQGMKGESRNVLAGKGAIRIDELTVSGLFDYFGKDSKVVEELYTVQSDDWTAKNDVMIKIIQDGKPPSEYKRGETRTKKLMRTYFISIGLDPGF